MKAKKPGGKRYKASELERVNRAQRTADRKAPKHLGSKNRKNP